MKYERNPLSELLPPAGRPKSATPLGQDGASCAFKLGGGASEGVKALSELNGVSAYVALSAAWQVLLGRYYARDELIVGSTAANRYRAELENVISPVTDHLTVKGILTGNPTFKEMLVRVRDAASGAYKHQQLAGEILAAESGAAPVGERRLFIKLMFMTEPGLTGAADLNDFTANEWQMRAGTGRPDLMVVLKETPTVFEGRIAYNTRLFDEPRIKGLAEAYRWLVKAAAAEPDTLISELPLLTDAERLRLTEWNDTAAPYADHHPVHQMVADQAGAMPDAIAVVYEGEHLTYRGLRHGANQLAHYLRQLGNGPEVPVGVCVERSLDMAISVLGILEAGAAYLPLDLAYPKERLRFMLEDARLSVLITRRHLLEKLPDHNTTMVCLDSQRSLIAGQCSEDLMEWTRADGLAYVMYTSGSTGRPKGAGLPHRALANLIEWHTAGLASKPRTLQFASLSFDVSFYEMFTTWASGGTLFILPEPLRWNIPEMTDFLLDNQIEKAVLPVVVLQQLAEEYSFGKLRLAALREVITTGEPLHITRPVAQFFEDFKLCSLHNHYGPAETHVVTSYALSGPPDSWPAHPPIGKPIANTRLHILDSYLNPVPLGAVGELYIGGVALARGYWNRADLTGERFIPDPFGCDPGERLYKTGDLARYQEDGNIAFLSRADHQLKIHGFRVELGEIESVLAQHPAVRQAVVVSRSDAAGNRRLLAYVAADQQQKLTADELRVYLKARLPDYMRPSAYTILERLPVTPAGKVDRAALSATDWPDVEHAEELMPARTPAEDLVVSIWSDILGVERIGINSNFFSLGGDSLRAVEVVLRLHGIFHIEVPVRCLFASPSVSDVVKFLSTALGGREIAEEVAWTFLQLAQLSDKEVHRLLGRREVTSLVQ